MRTAVYKHEIRELIRLALPVAAAQAGAQLMGLVDVAVLGRYGARELAASGLGNVLFFGISIAGMGIVLGIDPLISQAVGAGDRPRARRLLWQGLWLSLITTAVLTLIIIATSFALPYTDVQAELIEPAKVYVLIRAIGLAPHLMFYVVRAYLQAHGVTRPMLTSMIIANVVNLIADIVLVFGAGPIPSLGVAGAAMATVFCTFLQLAIIGAAVRHIHVDRHVDLSWNQREIARAWRVGLPVGVQMALELGVFALVGILAARLGTLHLAAHQVAIGLASFTYTIALGIGAAGSARVGIGVGAGDLVSTRVAGHVAIATGAAVMAINGLLFALFPRALAGLMTNQGGVIRVAIPLLIVAAVFQLSDGIQAVGAGVLRGAGDTKYSLYANLVGHWLIGLPIALWLGFAERMGIVGLWWGLCAGLSAVAMLLVVRFERLSSRGIAPL